MSALPCMNAVLCANVVTSARCDVCELAKHEADYKRAFDAGVEWQKKAAPPPKAKQYRDERDAIVELIQKLWDEAVRAVDEAEFTPGEFDLVDHKKLVGELLDAVKAVRK